MDEVSIQKLEQYQYLVSYAGRFSFRVAIENGVTYVALCDLAGCCGYVCGTRIAQRSNVPKVKINVRHKGGRSVGKASLMWFLAIDDAVQFVRERALDSDFKEWFAGYSDNLRELAESEPKGIIASSSCPVQDQPKVPKAPEAQPKKGVNITPEQIDKLIIDLLELKASIVSA